MADNLKLNNMYGLLSRQTVRSVEITWVFVSEYSTCNN